jgi:hypothetical protein
MRINGLNMDAENGLTLRDAFDSDAEYEASIETMADFCPFCCEAPCRCYRGPVEGNLVDVAGEASDAFPVPAFVRATRDLLSLEGEVMARAGEGPVVVSVDAAGPGRGFQQFGRAVDEPHRLAPFA